MTDLSNQAVKTEHLFIFLFVIMPLSFEPSMTDGRQQLSTLTLQDMNISQKSILRASIKDLYSTDQPVPPDNRLLNWKRCLEERRLQHRAIEASTRRKPDELCMNSADDQRYLVEQKQMLEFCRSPWPTKVCKLFEPGEERSALCYGRPTLAEQCIITPVAHVGVPKHIQEEKDVLGQGDRKTAKDKWLENPNLPRKLELLDERFHEVNPYEPEMDELAVIGNNMMRSVQLGSMIAPVISVYHENEFREIDDSVSSATSLQNEASSRSDEDSWACIKINDRLLTWSHTPVQSSAGSVFAGSNSISDIESALNVHKLIYKADVEEKLKHVIRFENIGNVKIRFSWHRKSDNDALPGSEAIRTSKFFFNKNSGVFLPGQIYEFPFWFETKRPGIFEEYWTLTTEPSMLKDGFKTCVQLYADASSSTGSSKAHGLADLGETSHVLTDISVYLDKREIESCAAELVHELADRRRPLAPSSLYDYLLHRDAAFADIGAEQLYFPPELEARVSRAFGSRPLDRLRAQHATQPIALKAHARVSSMLGDAIDRMEEHAKRLRATFGVDADGEADAEDDSNISNAASHEVSSILKTDSGLHESVRRIVFSDQQQEFPVDEDQRARRATATAFRDALSTHMYFDLCHSVEDACSTLDELRTPRTALLYERAPTDSVRVPPPPAFVPAELPEELRRDTKLSRLTKIYDFGGRSIKKKAPTICQALKEMPLIQYEFDQIGVEELPPLPKSSAIKGSKEDKKGKTAAKEEGKKGAKGAKK